MADRRAGTSHLRTIGMPMTEPVSHVEQQVQARIAAARVKVQAAKQQRAELSAARRRGLAARHANKLRRLAEQEQKAQQQAHDEPDDE